MRGNPKPARGSHRLDKAKRRAEEDQALAEAYEFVNVRDGNCCRVTGRFVSAGAVDGRVRREHHHLQPRSLAPSRIADVTNIILVCAEAHELITGGFIEVEGTNANKPLFYHWNEHAMQGRNKPFRLKSKRTVAA